MVTQLSPNRYALDTAIDRAYAKAQRLANAHDGEYIVFLDFDNADRKRAYVLSADDFDQCYYDAIPQQDIIAAVLPCHNR